MCVLGMLFFYAIPFMQMIYRTICNLSAFRELFRSKSFWLAIKNMTLFFLIFDTLLLVISTLVALCMQYLVKMGGKSATFFFVFHLLPMVLPSSVIAIVLQIFLQPYGILNGILNTYGMNAINFLDSKISFYILGLLYLWKNYGYLMVILYGGFMSVPSETIEAAEIDGANKWKVFFRISLPQMKDFIQFAIIIGVIGVFKVFRESYMIFGKYPDESVYMIQNYINNCIHSLNYTRLAAVSLVLIVLFSIVIYIIYFREVRGDNRENKRFS